MNNCVTVTVFTPTFNRVDLIKRLYDSLLKQDDYDFEWVVVDDGSTDGTADYLEQIEFPPFDIRVIRQRNSGKHVAINKGVGQANGSLFFIVDSDDYLVPQAISTIKKIDSSITVKDKYCGLAGLRIDPSHNVIGSVCPSPFVDCTALERYRYKIIGDKAEVYYTSVLKKYPFPSFDDETFLTESVVWYRMGYDGFKIRWTNIPIYICDYQETGLSHTTGKCSRNFRGYQLQIKESLRYKQLPIAVRMKDYLAYSAICFKLNRDIRQCAEEINMPYYLTKVVGIAAFTVYRVRQFLAK